MNQFLKYSAALAGMPLLLLSSCIDKNYDLSDIDTESEFKMTDLTLPINLDQILLDDIITLKEGDNIRVENGQYVVYASGDFNSDDVTIDRFRADAPTIEPSRVDVSGQVAGGNVSMPVPAFSSKFSYVSNDVNGSIQQIEKVWLDNMTVKVDFSLAGIPSEATNVAVKGLAIQLPTGWDCTPSQGSYDSATGRLSIGQANVVGGKFEVSVVVAAAEFNESNSTHTAGHLSASYFGEIGVSMDAITFSMPQSAQSTAVSCSLTATYAMSQLVVTRLSGVVNYSIDDFKVEDVDLSNIPEFFKGQETDVTLADPQMYLEINNPLADYGASARAGFSLTPVRDGVDRPACTLDEPYFVIGSAAGSAPQKFCFAPEFPYPALAGYESAQFVPFTSLRSILAGGGLPTSIKVKAIDPSFHMQHVEGLELGKDLGHAGGTYTFYAPLAFEHGSLIVYNKTKDGWNDEDIDCMEIDELHITADLFSTLPVDIELYVYPLDTTGNRIPGVTVQPVTAKAKAQEHVEFVISGKIRHLDGVQYIGRCRPDQSAEVLRPDQSISLTNVKIKATGSYTKKL